MDLRTRYTALVTLMTQYIKFAGDSLKRLEEEEVSHPLKANQAKRTARQMKSNTSAGIIHNVSSRYRLLEFLKYSAYMCIKWQHSNSDKQNHTIHMFYLLFQLKRPYDTKLHWRCSYT